MRRTRYRIGFKPRLSHLITVLGLSEVLNLIKDVRSDTKKLIETLDKLNKNIEKLENHISQLERLNSNLERLVRELDRTNRNVEHILSVLKEVKL
jgi:ABC-type transporter Mla subunit MlaD